MRKDKGRAALFGPYNRTVMMIAVIILLAAAVIIVWGLGSPDFRQSALIELAGGAFFISLIYLLGQFVGKLPEDLAKEDELNRNVTEPLLQAMRDVHTSTFSGVPNIPWSMLFRGTKEIYLVVQGWDGWQRRLGHELESFFLQPDAKLHIVLPRLPNQGDLDSQLNHSLHLMAERQSSKDQDSMRKEIQITADNFKGLIKEILVARRNSAPSKSKRPNLTVDDISDAEISKLLQIHYTSRMIWYCAVYFAPNKLLISIYQHMPFLNVRDSDAPQFVVRTDVFPEFDRWFLDEWKHLVANSTQESQ